MSGLEEYTPGPVIHMLIPKELKVWCRPNTKISAELTFCTKPSEANCANCLTAMRSKVTGRKTPFKVRNTKRVWETEAQ